MTKKNAKRFLERLEEEPAFRAKLKRAKTLERKKEILKVARLYFTKQELKEVWEEIQKRKINKRKINKSEMRSLAAAGTKRGSKRYPFELASFVAR